ncbi:MAG: MBL fold metallo-hydrolase [Candidatus Hermodarchaeota archaeon]
MIKKHILLDILIGTTLLLVMLVRGGVPISMLSSNFIEANLISAVESTRFTNSSVVEYGGVELRWLGHAGFQFKKGDIVIYVDPYGLNHDRYYEMADFIVSTHDHYDHCNYQDIIKIADNDTIYLTVIQAKSLLESALYLQLKEAKYFIPYDNITFNSITFEFVPAYNIEGGWHPREANYLGVIIDFNGARFYHAGDTDHIPEISSFNTNIALIPVSGASQMTASEAVEAVESLKISSPNLELAIPMHFGFQGQPGTGYDGLRFHENADIDTIIMLRYSGEEEPFPTETTHTTSGFGGLSVIVILSTVVILYRAKRIQLLGNPNNKKQEK